jgi:hypothetical protein
MGVCPYPPGFGEGLVRLKTAGREAQSGYQRDHSLKTAGRPLVLQPEQYEAETKIPVGEGRNPREWRERNTERRDWRNRRALNALIAAIADIAGNGREG